MIHRYVARDKNAGTSQERLLSVLKHPIITEKSTLGSKSGQYFFRVANDANKIEVKRAVEHLFSVNVESVNTIKIKGKTKTFKGRIGRKSDYKKAAVRIKGGQKIDFEAFVS